MKIVCTGTLKQQEELRAKLNDVELSYCNVDEFVGANLQNFDLIIDLDFDSDPISKAKAYKNVEGKCMILGATKTNLYSHFTGSKNYIIGINNLCGFINKPIWEMTALNTESENQWNIIAAALKLDCKTVHDRVGMVSPRVICMIINEAYYTVQEGTANKSDIDIAMKLGTSYPYGPFEWAGILGLKNVYDVLSSVYEDTKDERYKICPMLRKEATL
ncbi:MAG: 3-hydroxyacyl-CoA dehydrogenase family protein [Bacteroidota bacterium]|nr:3-hydroxyacyl-CoA dehydrogenase family protein [Bacteroidota bacterium]